MDGWKWMDAWMEMDGCMDSKKNISIHP